ncbi:MAG: isopenicillin N synthase-like dioxygenase [Myxococcota bacterium]|jgi:isopenicillin N synthase-like dioxygenase
MATEGVPVVDLNDFHDPQRRAAFVQTLGDAITRLGFVRVTGHSLDPLTVEQTYALIKKFFFMSAEVKQQYLVPGGAGQRGYSPYRAEHAKGFDLPDLKEFWHVGRELLADHPLTAVYPDNVWPAELPDFQAIALALYAQLELVSNILLTGLALYLGEPADGFTGLTDDGNTILRMIHYPALDDHTFIPGAVRAAAHEDINFITLLITSTASGLQILTRDNKWLDVNAEPGEIVADSGDMLSRITNGRLPSTTHRVINPDVGFTNRFSMPFFVHPRPEAVLRVLDCCRGADLPQPAEDITGQEFLNQRLAEIGLTRL